MTNPMDRFTSEQRKEFARKAHETRRRNSEQKKHALEIASVEISDLEKRILTLREELQLLEKQKVLNCVAETLTGKRLLSQSDISDGASEYERASGVYFLLQDNEVVYVGQAVNVYARIAQHVDKKFNRFAFIKCRPESLDKLESIYIHFLMPKLNGNQKNGAKSAPINLDKLLGL